MPSRLAKQALNRFLARRLLLDKIEAMKKRLRRERTSQGRKKSAAKNAAAAAAPKSAC